jgi:hypothetical protein
MHRTIRVLPNAGGAECEARPQNENVMQTRPSAPPLSNSLEIR